jgi:DNA-directed RNA polymerase subunit RPC12/RpoP
MSNASWVCFDCRRVVRTPTYPRRVVPCPECGNPCFCLGRQIPVPPKNKVAAWTRLRKEMRAMTAAWELRREV